MLATELVTPKSAATLVELFDVATAVSGCSVSGLGSVMADEAIVAVFWIGVVRPLATVPFTVKVSVPFFCNVNVPVVKLPFVSEPLAAGHAPPVPTVHVQLRPIAVKFDFVHTSLNVTLVAGFGPKLVTTIV